MKKFLIFFTMLIYTFTQSIITEATDVKELDKEYVESCFTTVAAASCLGVYLPENSTEFNYLRSYGWEILPQKHRSGDVETNFAIAKNYFPELGKEIYLVTFRGSASKGDWSLNLKTNKVNFGGHDLATMETMASLPLNDEKPAIHKGFNEYVNSVLRTSVLDDQGNFKGVFKKVAETDNSFLILSGHSLGGAAATLLGERLISLGLPKDKFIIITFGAPAIGNKAFADKYGNAVNLLRVTNTADPIPGSLQTFFGGYKQFGKHIKYSMSTKISNVQHAMAMYFDYSVSENYKIFDKMVELGKLEKVSDTRITADVPVVALWINTAENLQRVASVTDVKRFVTDEFKHMLPSYVVMDTSLTEDAYEYQDIVQLSRYTGADYVLVCGVDGELPRNQKFWYLKVDQALFDKEGKMLSIASYAQKVLPAVGNIQAVGECLAESRKELNKQLPFVMLNYAPKLVRE